MLSCEPATQDNDLLYDRVSACRDVPAARRLAHLGPRVKRAYASYAAAGNRPTGLASIISNTGDSELLRGNWGVLGRVGFSTVRAAVLNASGGRCCLCGHAKAGEVDHYLPKAHFPEFTVFTFNLVAACRRCNGRKSDNYARGTGAPAFLHPYVHHLPDEDFLAVEVEIADTVLINYTVQQTPAMSTGRFRTLQSHFKRLALDVYYKEEAVRVLDEQLNAYYAYYADDGAQGVSRYLLREADSNSACYGPTHWKPVLLRALAQDGAFCERGFEVLGPERSIG